MVASKVQNSAAATAEFGIVNLGIKEAMVASKIKKSKLKMWTLARPNFDVRSLTFGILKNNGSGKLRFRRLVIPRKCCCQIKNCRVLGIIMTASAIYKNVR